MPEQDYFKKALSDFTFDVAGGGAIRHLADRSYTVKQITERLDFHVPYEKVRQTVWQHFLDTGHIRLEEPGNGTQTERSVFVTDCDKYGRKSFRKVAVQEKNTEKLLWKELLFKEEEQGKLAVFLAKKREENGEEFSYVSCRFGLESRQKPEEFKKMTELLEERQKEYILGLPWTEREVFVRLDLHMEKIVVKLYECGKFHGICYFLKTGEKVQLA